MRAIKQLADDSLSLLYIHVTSACSLILCK